jgi:hypothetical protein
MEHSDWTSYFLKVHQHELVAHPGNFLVVVELIIKKGIGKGRERNGKGGEKKGERKRKREKGTGEGQTPKNVEID